MKIAGDRCTQESVDGSGGRYKCAGREAGTATICHAAERVAAIPKSGYMSRGWKRRSWNAPRSTGDRCGWSWSRICVCAWRRRSPTVPRGGASMTSKEHFPHPLRSFGAFLKNLDLAQPRPALFLGGVYGRKQSPSAIAISAVDKDESAVHVRV
jgi:hypothetical protein